MFPESLGLLLLAFSPLPGESRNLGFCFSSPILEMFAAKFWKFHVLPVDANKDQVCPASSWDILFAALIDTNFYHDVSVEKSMTIQF